MAKYNTLAAMNMSQTAPAETAAQIKGYIFDIIGDFQKENVAPKRKLQDLGQLIKHLVSCGTHNVHRSGPGIVESIRTYHGDYRLEFCYFLGECFKIKVSYHDNGPNWDITKTNFHQLRQAMSLEVNEKSAS